MNENAKTTGKERRKGPTVIPAAILWHFERLNREVDEFMTFIGLNKW